MKTINLLLLSGICLLLACEPAFVEEELALNQCIVLQNGFRYDFSDEVNFFVDTTNDRTYGYVRKFEDFFAFFEQISFQRFPLVPDKYEVVSMITPASHTLVITKP